MTFDASPHGPDKNGKVVTTVPSAAKAARAWLFDDLLPLWSTKGQDAVHGGFFEQIDVSGARVDLPKRCRVQARQAYSFVTAGRMGWTGPWLEKAKAGVEFMLAHHTRADGLMRSTTSRSGAVVDDTADNYDQAFAMFALAHLYAATRDKSLKSRAMAILDAMQRDRAHPQGGFYEHTGREASLLANPHMHLFEAALAWLDVEPDERWSQLAREISGLCVNRFIDPHSRALREYFAPGWQAEVGDRGRITEPGHQFEWVWLLVCWNRHGGAVSPDIIRGLYDAGAGGGVDAVRNVAISELWTNGQIKNAATRLWPQTERLKAAIALARLYPGERKTFESAAIDSWMGLSSFIRPDHRGLFFDIQQPDGSFVSTPSPASSLYHIICALEELHHYDGAPQS